MSRCLLTLIACGLLLSMTTGCASIISKSEYPVAITSAPDNANISICNSEGKNVFTGRTPATVTLKTSSGFFQGEDYDVTFSKAGYPDKTVRIERGLDGWYLFGNLVFGGVPGWLIVDPLTGAMWTLSDLHVDLSSSSPTAATEGEIKIMAYNDVPKELHSKLVRIQ